MSFTPAPTYADLKDQTVSIPGMSGSSAFYQRDTQCAALCVLRGTLASPFYTPPLVPDTLENRGLAILAAVAVGAP